MATDIVELMDSLSIASAYFVGHSLGGKVAMQLAMTSPERVKSVVIADIAPVKYSDNNINIINALYSLSKVKIEDRKAADAFLSDRGIEVSVRAFFIKKPSAKCTGQF